MKIKLNNPDEVNEFVAICDSFADHGIDVKYGSLVFDGRSTVSMLNVMGHDVDVKIHAERADKQEFEMQIEQFEVD